VDGRAEQLEAELAVLAGGLQLITEPLQQRVLADLIMEHGPDKEWLGVDRHPSELRLVDLLCDAWDVPVEQLSEFRLQIPPHQPLSEPRTEFAAHALVNSSP